DLLLVLRELLGERLEPGSELRVLILCCELPCPVEGEVEVASAVVELAGLAGGGPVVLEHLSGRAVERLGQELGAPVVVLVRQQLERGAERQEFSERVPTQVVLLKELLDVPGRRPAGTGLEQPTSVEQGHDRKHL